MINTTLILQFFLQIYNILQLKNSTFDNSEGIFVWIKRSGSHFTIFSTIWLNVPLVRDCLAPPLSLVEPIHTHLYCNLPSSYIPFTFHRLHITNGSGIVWLNSRLNHNIIILLPWIKMFYGGTPLYVTCNIGACVSLPACVVELRPIAKINSKAWSCSLLLKIEGRSLAKNNLLWFADVEKDLYFIPKNCDSEQGSRKQAGAPV